MMVTSAQLRAARAMLDWSRGDLATKSGVAPRTIARAESDPSSSELRTLKTLVATLETAGIRFVETADGPGVVQGRAKE